MKIKIAILVFGCISATAQSDGNFLGANVGNPAQEQAAHAAALQRQKRLFDSEYQKFIPKDPWREIDGQTNYAKGDGWVQFGGKILEVQPHGVRVDGAYGKAPFKSHYNDGSYDSGTVFFVENYPYQCAEGESLISAQNLTAKESGVYTYPTAIGGTSTIRKLDYGVPCGAPEWFIKQQKEQADAAQAAANAAVEAQKKKNFELQKHAVEWLLTQATNGSASAQCSLGIHYLNGQGVETNKETAVYWLTQAANQGDMEASNKLSQLKSP